MEVNFDGLVGSTHTHAGLSPGNLASTAHAGAESNPQAAALQGLQKMRFNCSLGLAQGVLPPHERPHLPALRRLGLSGSDGDLLAQAKKLGLLGLVSSASAMWTANAATVVPSADAGDGRLHFVPANLVTLFHRSLESATTARLLSAIFEPAGAMVHAPLPASPAFSDEGAANHTRLATPRGALHLFGYGRQAFGQAPGPSRYPARQTREASATVARFCALPASASLLWPQSPSGIDAGAFHSDVLAVGNEHALLFHERAFSDPDAFETELRRRLGGDLWLRRVTEAELSAAEAVATYPFNSQLVTLPTGGMALIAPAEAEQSRFTRRLLDELVQEEGPIGAVHYLNVTGSMLNGGGPACLRLRVPLSQQELGRLPPGVLMDGPRLDALEAWVRKHYRDRLRLSDLADPDLLDDNRRGLDELTQLLGVGSVYDFQLTG